MPMLPQSSQPQHACALIVAAGQGRRMKGAVRKQYMPVAGRPILSYSLSAFDLCPEIERIVCVLPEGDLDFFRKNLGASLATPVLLVEGGRERSDSVFSGLQALEGKAGIVAIHDGVRPFVRPEQISLVVSGAREHGACILAVPASDTLKAVHRSGRIERTIDREGIWLAQTPQAFRFDLIFRAHQSARSSGDVPTDDAQLLERQGIPVHVVPGDSFNLKITTPQDLALAEAIAASPKFRP